jgi:hypothetical protein
VPGSCSAWNFDLLKNAAVRYPCALATPKTVGSPTSSRVAEARLFQSTPCLSGSSPVSMDVCDGSVLLGVMVLAERE